MSYLSISASFEYLCYGSTTVINILILSAREPSLDVRNDVYKERILTSEVDPRAKRVNNNLPCAKRI